MARLSTAKLVERSDRIVTARCTETESAWREGTLVTVARFEVEETIKGKAVTMVEVLVPGGIDLHHDPPLQLLFPGSPQIATGEEALLFLHTLDDSSGTSVLVGLSQGLYALSADGGTSRRAHRDLSQLTLLESDGRRRPGESDERMLAGLLDEVRALAAAENTAHQAGEGH